ncbi:MAG: hypothetical protein ILNGONEN_00546 [Syntrophorhabdaceae bacterium]|nr:hypothetical protein [Syntrophorhabdaceae bacterium]
MTPLHPGLRRLIQRYIPELTREELARYESLLALRLELTQQKSGVPAMVHVEAYNDQQVDDRPRQRYDALIKLSENKAADIIARHYRKFELAHRLWMARRQIALHQGGLLQIPTTWKGFCGLVKTTHRYYWDERKTHFQLARLRLADLSIKHWIFIAVMVVLLGLGIYTLSSTVPSPDIKSQGARQ